jgi:hypothetical protein
MATSKEIVLTDKDNVALPGRAYNTETIEVTPETYYQHPFKPTWIKAQYQNFVSSSDKIDKTF